MVCGVHERYGVHERNDKDLPHDMMEKMSQRKKVMLWTSFGIILVAAAGFITYFIVFARPNPALKKDQVRIGNAIFDVEVARTPMEKARGLSFRERLGENQGMLFLFDKGARRRFWMKDMRFSIDIIWIGGGKVMGFAERVAPEPGVPLWGLKIYASPAGTDKVLEVSAGTVAKYHLRLGDEVAIVI